MFKIVKKRKTFILEQHTNEHNPMYRLINNLTQYATSHLTTDQ